jgi:iron(III) transport system substrate-binding protein
VKSAALGGATLAAAACQPPSASAPQDSGPRLAETEEWAELVEAARREGTLNLYGGQGQDNRDALVAPFENAFPGITVNGTFAQGRELVTRIAAERTAGKNIADILIGPGASGIVALKPTGALAPLPPALVLPEVTDTSRWLGNRLWYLDAEEPYTTLAFVGMVQSSVTVNTEQVDPRRFTSYWELLDPQWKGKMVVTDVRRPGAGAVPTRYWYVSPDLGPPFIEKLFGEMDVTLGNDQRQMLDWVASGRFPIGVLLSSTEVLHAMDQGLPVALLPGDQFKEGGPLGVGGGTVSMIDGAPNPNVSKLYVNWLLSGEGQRSWQYHVGHNSTRTDIPKDEIPEYMLPKPGRDYLNTAAEEYAVLSSTVIADLIDRVTG